MLCPSCHTLNRDNAKFCKGCGLSFTPDSPEAPGTDTAWAGPPAAPVVQVAQAPVADTAPSVENRPGSAPLSASDAQNQPPAPLDQGEADIDTQEDISLAPTQILTPQQMIAYQSRRWQRELAQSEDIADAPTLLFTPAPGPGSQAQQPHIIEEAEDITDMPTMMMPPEDASTPPVAQSEAVEGVQAPAPSTTEPTVLPENVHDTADSTPVETATQEATVNSTAESGTAPVAQAVASQEQSSEAFPVQAPGTMLGERYEVMQVVSSDVQEHIYEVTDHQGYKHCWNCGSEENTEDDGFCISCGAELLNAVYTLHEYPSTGQQNNESHILQGLIVNTFVEQGHTYVVEQIQASQSTFPQGVHVLAASDSDEGNVRRGEPNEDSTLVLYIERVHESISSPVGLFVVADGMGGHTDGQRASRMTIGRISERIVRELFMTPLTAEKDGTSPAVPTEDEYVALVQGAVEDANAAICQFNQNLTKQGTESDMGSTLTGFLLVGDHAYIFNVGDSRTYLLREGKLIQLTTDHSLVGQMVAGGLIEPDDVYTHPQRSQIFRSIGDKLNVQVDVFKQQVYPGDILLSCSDGLWEMVRNPQIAETLKNAPEPQSACSQLIELANANGGDDNVSAVVVFVR